MTTFNIDTFINSLNKQGTVQTNKYEVKIARPRIFVDNEAIFEQLKYRAESVRVPGITLETTDVRRYGHDIRQKMPTGASYNDIGITFIEQDMNRISKFFYYWLHRIYAFRSSADIGATLTTIPASGLPQATVEYKDYYSTRIEIDVFNNSGDLTMSVILEDAFPITMGDVSLGWSDRNSLYKLNVSFSYSFITIRNEIRGDFFTDPTARPLSNIPLLPSLPPI